MAKPPNPLKTATALSFGFLVFILVVCAAVLTWACSSAPPVYKTCPGNLIDMEKMRLLVARAMEDAA